MPMSPRLLRPSASGFSPRSITGLALWLDASDASTLFQDAAATTQATATSDPVGAWLDKSGNARHATQSTAGSRPTISANTQGGKKMLGFDGANGKLTIPFPVTAADPVAMIAVARRGPSAWGGGGGGGYGSFLNSTGQGGAGGPQLRVDTGNIEVQGGSNKSTVLGSNVGVGSCAIIEGMVSSLATSLYVQGALVDSDDGAGAIVTTGTRTSIGAWNDGTQGGGPLAGDIAELICYRASLTTSQRQRLERYLAAKWGITLAPQVSNADAQNWINRVYANGGTVSSSTAAAVSTFCDAIDAASIRDRFYRMNLFAGGTSGTTAGLAACLVPLYRGPSLGGTQYGNTTDTNVGPFVVGDYAETGASGGLRNNSGGKLLRTGLTPANLDTVATGHMAVYHGAYTSIGAFAPVLSVQDGSFNRYRMAWLSQGNMGLNWGGSTALPDSSAAITGGGLYSVIRRSSTDLQSFVNTTSVNSESASTTPATNTQDWAVFGSNNSGTNAASTATHLLKAYSIGKTLSSAELSAYYTAMQAFQTAMGRNV